MGEREVPITIAQRVVIVIKFLTDKNGPNEIGVDDVHNTGNQHYQRRKLNSGIKSFVEQEMPYKTQVIDAAQGQASPQRISQWFVTLLKTIIGLLWLKFVRSLVCISGMGVCSPSSVAK